MSRHIIIGTGPLGSATARALLRRGEEVILTNRRGAVDRPDKLPSGLGVARLDANEPEAVRAIAQGSAVVYQCAQPPYHRWVQEFPALQQHIVEGVTSTDARLVVAENLYGYGAVTVPMTENLPLIATTRKGQVRARMTESLLKAHQSGQVAVTMGRASDFFGPGVTGSALGDMAFAPLVKGKRAIGFGNIDLPHTYTYIDDFGEALAILGQRDEALGKAWHVPSGPTHTTRQLLEMARQAAGTQGAISAMGRPMVLLGSLFSPDARESLEMLYEFEKPFVMDYSRFVQAFGDHSTPHSKAMENTVSWFRQRSDP